MRWTATISGYEQRHPASTVGIDAFCRKSRHSRLEHYTPLATGARRRRNRTSRTQLARPSGRQDSNLRPLVPQTSPYFPIRAEFDLECFRREMVGMTTSACQLESIGIAVDIHRLPHAQFRAHILFTAPRRRGSAQSLEDGEARSH